MPQRVHLPDGRIVNFPDGMSPDQMSSAMGEIAAQPNFSNVEGGSSQPEQKSIGGFAQNLATSGGRFLKDTALGAVGLGKTAVNMHQDLMNPGSEAAEGRRASARTMIQNAPQIASALGGALKNRYGGVEEIKNTLYNDPVGVLSDVSTVAMPAKGLLNAGKFTKAAKIAGAVGEATNPMRAIGAVAQPALHGAANLAVRTTLRAPAAVRNDFGGSKAVADAILKDRVYSEASAQRKLAGSVAEADTMLQKAEAAGVPGVRRRDVARAVMGEPKDTAKIRTRLGVSDATPELQATAQAVMKNNPVRIKLTDAQKMKREAQSLAYEAGADNQSVKKAAEIAKAKALRAGIEEGVPEVGPVNERSQRLLGSQKAFEAAEDRPRALTNFLALLGGSGAGLMTGGTAGIPVALALKALDSPRAGAMAGIGLDSIGKGMNAASLRKAALLSRLAEQVPDE